MWMQSQLTVYPSELTNEVTHTQLLEVEAALTNVFTSTAFKRITFYFHYLYRECPIMRTVLAQPTQRWAALLLSMKK